MPKLFGGPLDGMEVVQTLPRIVLCLPGTERVAVYDLRGNGDYLFWTTAPESVFLGVRDVCLDVEELPAR